MTTPQETTPVRPHVLIVGAGLGGLMLGTLLEKANIPYTIFERATAVKPLGAAMSVGGQVMGVFRQLGIYDQYCEIAKPYTLNIAVKETGEKMLEMDYGIAEEICGYQNFIVPRPLFHNLLLNQVPPSKILYGKRVHAIDQDDEKVRIETTDGATYEGDILVGADGAYSGVRQRLYEALMDEGKLPESDQEDLPFSCTCLVGQTEPLDLEVFHQLKDRNYPFVTTMCDDKPFMFTLYGTAQDSICWMVIRFHDVRSTKAAQEKKYRREDNSEWGPVAAQVMSEETKDIPITLGNGRMTLADIYSRTPKDRMSMVMLEEKLFQTWYHGRTVLLGDACHKLHPSGGQGAITAMHDAIALANLLYALPSNTTESISKSFAEYHAERYPPAVAAFNGSQLLSEIRNKGLVGTMTLSLSFERYMLLWVWRVILVSVVKNRPYVGFLPKVEEKKSAEPASKSPSAQKARALYKKRKGVAAAVAP